MAADLRDCGRAFIGILLQLHVAEVSAGRRSAAAMFKDQAWRRIFWMSMPPGVLFVLGGFFVAESPRWLFRRGKREQAHCSAAALATPRSRPRRRDGGDARSGKRAEAKTSATGATKRFAVARRVVLPFLLACVILFCNTATGINSSHRVQHQHSAPERARRCAGPLGLRRCSRHEISLFTIVGMTLVDRKGAEVPVHDLGHFGHYHRHDLYRSHIPFHEALKYDVKDTVQAMVTPDQGLSFHFDQQQQRVASASGGDQGNKVQSDRASLAMIYSYGDYTAATSFVTHRRTGGGAHPDNTRRCVPANKVEAFFKNPFGNLDAAATAPLKIDAGTRWQRPDIGSRMGWWPCCFTCLWRYAIGPGVCVWLALSELMPTRIVLTG